MRLLPLLPLLALAAPALATRIDAPIAAAPALATGLTPAERSAYRTAFAALRAGDYATAAATLDALPNGLLTPVARAELLLASGAPNADAAGLTALLAAAPELPEAPALAALARARGATDLPLLPPAHDLVRLDAASKRLPTRPTRADAVSAALAARANVLLKANDATTAEPLIEAAAAALAPEALTEWRARLAWSYLLAADDADARRVAAVARTGAGDWAAQADWILGLAAWRAGVYDDAAEAFASLASRARDPEMMAAGLTWAARADQAGGHPERSEPRLRSAARLGETFYGMIAASLLGAADQPQPPLTPTIDMLAAAPNARAAAALVDIGETALADTLLRQQARIGSPAQHGALVLLAGRLGLPGTQVWLAQNGPKGTMLPAMARYPVPGWAPTGGWRVDRALCLAHALQESQLRVDATSRAGARGLMQLMPGTARLVAKHKGLGLAYDAPLADPATSLEYGQSYLEELADHAGTGGLLPKVIAAYNAGPNNVAAWGQRPGVMDDPLFFIETMPFAETRTYVTTVLRNYWMYQRATGAPTGSLAQIAAGKWPKFPRLSAMPQRVAYGTGAVSGTN
jgi:soluble lytic murein transglycosylase-like protein/TolA-binding protein